MTLSTSTTVPEMLTTEYTTMWSTALSTDLTSTWFDFEEFEESNNAVTVILSVLVPLFVLSLALLIFILWRKKKNNEEKANEVAISVEKHLQNNEKATKGPLNQKAKSKSKLPVSAQSPGSKVAIPAQKTPQKTLAKMGTTVTQLEKQEEKEIEESFGHTDQEGAPTTIEVFQLPEGIVPGTEAASNFYPQTFWIAPAPDNAVAQDMMSDEAMEPGSPRAEKHNDEMQNEQEENEENNVEENEEAGNEENEPQEQHVAIDLVDVPFPDIPPVDDIEHNEPDAVVHEQEQEQQEQREQQAQVDGVME